MSFNYNINGTRTLAIFLVLLFHLNFPIFSGGYIGVDIFFVISGYVISQSLYNTYKSEKSLKKTFLIFYEKRLLRIAPAVVFLSIITLIIFKFIFIEKHYLALIKSVLFTNIFVSNFHFWDESGYFGLDSTFKPLLHTWSLSVEMQAYLFLPLVLFFLFKYRNIYLLSIIFLISIFSVFFGEYFISRPFVFFFPFFRIHEFLIGCLIFYFSYFFIKKKLNYFYSYLGILIILICSTYYNENTNFPGLNSLLPLLGTTFIIISEDKKNSLLNNKFSQFFGNISYSFYLYHWIIIVALKYIFLKVNFDLLDGFIIFILTTLSAYLSYRFVELKFKYKENKKRNLLLIPLFIILFFIPYFIINNDDNKIFIKEDFQKKEVQIREQILKDLNKREKSKENELIIIGDSHAQDLFISISQNKENLKNYDKIFIRLNDSCIKYLGKKTTLLSAESYLAEKLKLAGQNTCDLQIKNFIIYLKDLREKNILISNRWSIDTVNNINKLINILIKNNNNVILVNRRPSFFDIPSLLKIKKTEDFKEFNKLSFNFKDKKVDEINKLIKAKTNKYNLHYFNLHDKICYKKSLSCTVMNGKDLFFIDNDHFSIKGSKYFGNNISKELLSYLN